MLFVIPLLRVKLISLLLLDILTFSLSLSLSLSLSCVHNLFSTWTLLGFFFFFGLSLTDLLLCKTAILDWILWYCKVEIVSTKIISVSAFCFVQIWKSLLIMITDSRCCGFPRKSCRCGQECRKWGCGNWWISRSYKIVGIFDIELWRQQSWATGKVPFLTLLCNEFGSWKSYLRTVSTLQRLSVLGFLNNQLAEKQPETTLWGQVPLKLMKIKNKKHFK